MVVVGGEAMHPVAGAQQLIIGLGCIAVQAVQLTAVVIDFKKVQIFQGDVVLIGLHTPPGMVIAAQEPLILPGFDILIYVFDGINLFGHGNRLAVSSLGAGIVKIQMVHRTGIPAGELVCGCIHIGLKSADGEESFIIQLGVPLIVHVVGKSDDRIALLLILFLIFCRCPFSVGNGAMTVQIRLIPVSFRV